MLPCLLVPSWEMAKLPVPGTTPAAELLAADMLPASSTPAVLLELLGPAPATAIGAKLLAAVVLARDEHGNRQKTIGDRR